MITFPAAGVFTGLGGVGVSMFFVSCVSRIHRSITEPDTNISAVQLCRSLYTRSVGVGLPGQMVV